MSEVQKVWILEILCPSRPSALPLKFKLSPSVANIQLVSYQYSTPILNYLMADKYIAFVVYFLIIKKIIVDFSD